MCVFRHFVLCVMPPSITHHTDHSKFLVFFHWIFLLFFFSFMWCVAIEFGLQSDSAWMKMNRNFIWVFLLYNNPHRPPVTSSTTYATAINFNLIFGYGSVFKLTENFGHTTKFGKIIITIDGKNRFGRLCFGGPNK